MARGGGAGDAQQLGGLLEGEPDEEPEADELCLVGILGREPVERRVERQPNLRSWRLRSSGFPGKSL